MITSVALNPAVDKIFDNFEPGRMYRVRQMVKTRKCQLAGIAA